MARSSFAAVALLALGAFPGAVHARGLGERQRSGAARAPAHAVAASVGAPNQGRLEGAVRLAPGARIRFSNPRGAHWGLPALVSMLERSAHRVGQRYQGASLLIGDLSRRHGGDIAGHHSHESGRDADIAFLFVGRHGEPVAPTEFLAVDESGVAVEKRAYRFDVARNWALVEAWVTDPGARIEHIFLADHLRERLLAYARARGTYLPVLHRAALALRQPSRGLSHDDHFHVRIECPRDPRHVCVPEARREPARVSLQRPKRRSRFRGKKRTSATAARGRSGPRPQTR
jgi:penicillin-insensitive murein DD-endopeptidase